MPRIFSLLLCWLVCFTSFAQDDLTDRLFSTIDQRLSFMEQVALFKAQNGLAIEGALWLSQPPDVESVDLDGIVRPRLTQLGDEIIAMLAAMASTGILIETQHRARFYELVQQRFVEDDEKNLLFEALQKATLYLPIP